MSFSDSLPCGGLRLSDDACPKVAPGSVCENSMQISTLRNQNLHKMDKMNVLGAVSVGAVPFLGSPSIFQTAQKVEGNEGNA